MLAEVHADKFIPVLQHKRSLILENCTFETTFDSPTLDRLVACTAMEGAHVGSHVLLCQSMHIQSHLLRIINQGFLPASAAMSTIDLLSMPVWQFTMNNCKFCWVQACPASYAQGPGQHEGLPG
jgi:hypothetical protein